MTSWKVIAVLALVCFMFVGITLADKWDESACDSRILTPSTIRMSCDGFLPW